MFMIPISTMTVLGNYVKMTSADVECETATSTPRSASHGVSFQLGTCGFNASVASMLRARGKRSLAIASSRLRAIAGRNTF